MCVLLVISYLLATLCLHNNSHLRDSLIKRS
nr:MAG TPA: hypothetical protein [Caudoviricetes sp.]